MNDICPFYSYLKKRNMSGQPSKEVLKQLTESPRCHHFNFVLEFIFAAFTDLLRHKHSNYFSSLKWYQANIIYNNGNMMKMKMVYFILND